VGKTVDLSVIIPARNEEFLGETVKGVLDNSRANTEIVVVLDGEWPVNSLRIDPRLSILYRPESIGQRAAMNEAFRLSRGRWIMKLDAHCAVDEGFDRKLLSVIKPDWTMAPCMKNLHVFDWVCSCGHRIYQGPIPKKCPSCSGSSFSREIVWIPKSSPNSCSFRFDRDLRFQYWREFGKRPEGKGPIAPSLSLQGSCFMLSREKYEELNIADEEHGSWGQQGTEVACKTWLSGGQVMIMKTTWYAHLFRTQAGFTFPYKLESGQVDHARKYSRELFLEGKWDKAIYDLNWLLEKFKPVPGWHDG